MDRPFRELHELYKILFERAEAEKQKERMQMYQGRGPQLNRMPPPDAKRNPSDVSTPSPLEAEALEDALEEMSEGGVL